MIHSIIDYVNQLEEKYADRVAFRWIDEATDTVKEKSYAEYAADIIKYAGYLQSESPDIAGKHVALMAANSYHYAVALIGTMLAGAVVIPMNIRDSKANLLRMLAYADCDLLYADDLQLQNNEAVEEFSGKKLPIFGYMYSDYTMQPTLQPKLDDVAMMMFTSGTTAISKCVMITHGNIIASIAYLDDMHNTVTTKLKLPVLKALHMMPMFHTAGIATILVWSSWGEEINLCTDMRNLIRDTTFFSSDYTFVVPMLLETWSKMIRRGKKSVLGDLKFILSGGALANPEDIKLLLDNGIGFIQSYGLTETCSLGIYNFVDASGKFDSLGKPGVQTEIKLDNGEICIKTPMLFSGYYHNQEETDAAICDGWFHTGDMGYMDEEGYIYLTGRKKNLIILSSGENVSPEELEGLVSANEAVKEIVVKEKNGKICAEIFCDEDKQEEIRAFVTEVNRTLAMYKRMTLVEFREEPFPRTASGKIKRV